MRIQFTDKSYIECVKNNDGKIVFTIAAKDHNNPQKKVTNIVELTAEQFQQLISVI